MKTTKITSRNTKSEILAAYNAMAKELRAAKARGAGSASSKSSSANKSSEMKALPPAPGHAEVATASREMSVGDIIVNLRGLTGRIGDASSSLQAELTAEATVLEELRAQAETVTRELKALHGIEVTDESLGELIARHRETSTSTELELSARREQLRRELEAARETWAAEQRAHARTTEEAATERDKALERDATEYAYALEREQAERADEREQARKRFELEQTELRERTTAAWTERERTLHEREQELVQLRAKAEAFEGERQAAVKRAEAEGMAIARRQAKTQTELRNKDHEGVRRVFEEKVQSLQQTIAKQEVQIDGLSRQLEDARKQTTELAVKAIDGASNASSFAAVKEIALEQAKNTTKGK